MSSSPKHRISLFGTARVTCHCGWSFKAGDLESIPTRAVHDRLLDAYINHLDVESRKH